MSFNENGINVAGSDLLILIVIFLFQGWSVYRAEGVAAYLWPHPGFSWIVPTYCTGSLCKSV